MRSTRNASLEGWIADLALPPCPVPRLASLSGPNASPPRRGVSLEPLGPEPPLRPYTAQVHHRHCLRGRPEWAGECGHLVEGLQEYSVWQLERERGRSLRATRRWCVVVPTQSYHLSCFEIRPPKM